jgi:nucleoside 2-deoxyribosyltransferase
MNARLVYLCGAIHEAPDATARNWRNHAKKALNKKNIMTVNPMDNDCRGREARFQKQLVEKDKNWITECDTLLVHCPEPSFGTAMEIYFAWSLHKQIVCVSRHTSPWLHYHATKVFDELDEALDSLIFPTSPLASFRGYIE